MKTKNMINSLSDGEKIESNHHQSEQAVSPLVFSMNQ
jgi:hypothetical protein